MVSLEKSVETYTYQLAKTKCISLWAAYPHLKNIFGNNIDDFALKIAIDRVQRCMLSLIQICSLVFSSSGLIGSVPHGPMGILWGLAGPAYRLYRLLPAYISQAGLLLASHYAVSSAKI